MNLTKNEIAIAERYLSKRERQLAKWPNRRGLMLVMCLVFALVSYRTISDGIRTINDDQATDKELSRALGGGPPPGLENRWAVGAMIKVSKILESRHQIVTYGMMQVALGYMEMVGAIILGCIAILRWNTGERDALICKLLRGKLQELEQSPAPGSAPPSQPPSSPA